MNSKLLIIPISASLLLGACKSNQSDLNQEVAVVTKDSSMKSNEKFEYISEQFADLRVLRYQIPSFDELSLQQKELLYYLSEAALSGRDMFWDQNFKYNLTIRKTIEAIIANYKGDTNNEEYKQFLVYAKRVFFSAGIHHHYGSEKFFPECSQTYFVELIKNCDISLLPIKSGENKEAFSEFLLDVIYNPNIAPKKVSLEK